MAARAGSLSLERGDATHGIAAQPILLGIWERATKRSSAKHHKPLRAALKLAGVNV